MATTPGWYPDYGHEAQLRYHDGAAWTDHVHTPPPAEPDMAGAPAGELAELAVESKQDPAWVKAIAYPLFGILGGLMLGGLLFNAIGAITPVTETTGTVRSLDIEFSQSSSSTNRRTYVVSGTTVDGDDWRITDEDAYNVLQFEGYPQPVTLAIGDWTDTPERVTGASFDINHQTTAARIGWAAVVLITAAIAAGLTAVIARNKNGGALHALVFAIILFGPGSWLGFQAFQWFQSA